jgi:hypothetical protein
VQYLGKVLAIDDAIFATSAVVTASAKWSRYPRHIRNRRLNRRGASHVRCLRRCCHQIGVRQIAVIDPPFGVSHPKARVTISVAVKVA